MKKNSMTLEEERIGAEKEAEEEILVLTQKLQYMKWGSPEFKKIESQISDIRSFMECCGDDRKFREEQRKARREEREKNTEVVEKDYMVNTLRHWPNKDFHDVNIPVSETVKVRVCFHCHNRELGVRFVENVWCQCPRCKKFRRGSSQLSTIWSYFSCKKCAVGWSAPYLDWWDLSKYNHVAEAEVGNYLCPSCFNLSVEYYGAWEPGDKWKGFYCANCNARWGEKVWERLFWAKPSSHNDETWSKWKEVQKWAEEMEPKMWD